MTDVLGSKAENYYSAEASKLYELSGAFKKIQESMAADALSISNFKPESKVLDLGCGTGFSLNVLKKSGMKTFGVDISLEMLKYAKKKSFAVALADMKSLPFKDESFDNLISISAIQWAEASEYEEIIREIRRVIKNEAVIQFYPKEKWEFDYFIKISGKIFRSCEVFAIGQGVKEKKYIKLKK